MPDYLAGGAAREHTAAALNVLAAAVAAGDRHGEVLAEGVPEGGEFGFARRWNWPVESLTSMRSSLIGSRR